MLPPVIFLIRPLPLPSPPSPPPCQAVGCSEFERHAGSNIRHPGDYIIICSQREAKATLRDSSSSGGKKKKDGEALQQAAAGKGRGGVKPRQRGVSLRCILDLACSTGSVRGAVAAIREVVRRNEAEEDLQALRDSGGFEFQRRVWKGKDAAGGAGVRGSEGVGVGVDALSELAPVVVECCMACGDVGTLLCCDTDACTGLYHPGETRGRLYHPGETRGRMYHPGETRGRLYHPGKAQSQPDGSPHLLGPLACGHCPLLRCPSL